MAWYDPITNLWNRATDAVTGAYSNIVNDPNNPIGKVADTVYKAANQPAAQTTTISDAAFGTQPRPTFPYTYGNSDAEQVIAAQDWLKQVPAYQAISKGVGGLYGKATDILDRTSGELTGLTEKAASYATYIPQAFGWAMEQLTPETPGYAGYGWHKYWEDLQKKQKTNREFLRYDAEEWMNIRNSEDMKKVRAGYSLQGPDRLLTPYAKQLLRDGVKAVIDEEDRPENIKLDVLTSNDFVDIDGTKYPKLKDETDEEARIRLKKTLDNEHAAADDAALKQKQEDEKALHITIINNIAADRGITPEDADRAYKAGDPATVAAYEKERQRQENIKISREYKFSPPNEAALGPILKLGPWDMEEYLRKLKEATGVIEGYKTLREIEDDYAVVRNFYKERRDEIANNPNYPQWLKARRDDWLSKKQERALTLYEMKIKNIRDWIDSAEKLVVQYYNAALDTRKLELENLKFQVDQMDKAKANDREWLKQVIELLTAQGINWDDLSPQQQADIMSRFSDPSVAQGLRAFDFKKPYDNKVALDWANADRTPQGQSMGKGSLPSSEAARAQLFQEWLTGPAKGLYTIEEIKAVAEYVELDPDKYEDLIEQNQTTYKQKQTRLGSDFLNPDEWMQLPGTLSPTASWQAFLNKRNYGPTPTDTTRSTALIKPGDWILRDDGKEYRVIAYNEQTGDLDYDENSGRAPHGYFMVDRPTYQ